MVNIDIGSGVATFTPPAIVAGEVGARLIFGLSINEWFYVVAIFCMLISTVASTVVAVKKASNPKKEE